MLQTEDYARSVLRAAKAEAANGEIESRVQIRMARSSLLTQDGPADFWGVIDEAVLHRQVGGRAVMRSQLLHIVHMADLPNVTLQVLPLAAGAHPGMEGSFVLLRFPDDADPDTVYVTLATGGVFQEKADELLLYEMIFNRLRDAALPPEESIALVASLAKEQP